MAAMGSACGSRATSLLLHPNISSKPIFSFSSIKSSCRCITSSASSLQSSTLEPHPASQRNVVEILEQRGLLESITSDDLRSASLSPLKVYCGFEPTAESLHLGNLFGLIVLSWFRRCGHTTVALIGGATGRVGDPSCKSLEQRELNLKTLEANTPGITNSIAKILENSGSDSNFSPNFVILNNYYWWKEFRFMDFLKEVDRFARVGSMMAKESVRRRLESEQGMSYTDFSYQLMQISLQGQSLLGKFFLMAFMA